MADPEESARKGRMCEKMEVDQAGNYIPPGDTSHQRFLSSVYSVGCLGRGAQAIAEQHTSTILSGIRARRASREY